MAPIFPSLVTRARLDGKAPLHVLCLALIVPLTLSLSARTDDSFPSRRAQAFALYDGNRLVDALPFLEKLHAEKPEDIAVLERLSFATLARSATLPDASEQKQERARARKLAEEAKAAGDDSNLIKIVLAIPEDGGEMAFAGTAEVQAAIEGGEAAFAKGDLDGALAAYRRALALDPPTPGSSTRFSGRYGTARNSKKSFQRKKNTGTACLKKSMVFKESLSA